MKKILIILLLPFLFLSCSKENPVNIISTGQEGSLVFKIDRTSAPSGIELITLTLSRNGFETITANMNLMSDSTAELQLNSIFIGIWHLQVQAKNSNGLIEYKGETDVEIIENTIVQVNLTLYPVFGGTGGIQIFVNWAKNSWADYLGNPVLTNKNQPSNPLDVRISKVLFDEDKFKMWYTAMYSNGQGDVWYAESNDGISWNTIGTNPVLSKGSPDSWDSYTVSASSVIKVDNQFRMYYFGWNTHPFLSKGNIGYAVSQDGINWIKNSDPLLTSSNEYEYLGGLSVLALNNIYYMYFDYREADSINGFSNGQIKIGLATSLDGISWNISNANPVIESNLSWEGESVSFPSVIYDNNNFKMIYGNGSLQTHFGSAVSSDGINFSKDAYPIFNNLSSVNSLHRIAYPNFIKVNGKYRVYYSGEDWQGGVSICLLQKN